jgi:hypothetical protein
MPAFQVAQQHPNVSQKQLGLLSLTSIETWFKLRYFKIAIGIV